MSGMKQRIKAYTQFTRMERMGIVCMCVLIVLLLVTRATMVYWVNPEKNMVQEQKMLAAWQVFERSQPKSIVADTATTNQEAYVDRSDEGEIPMPNIININTADSATLVRLKGIGPAMAHKILEYRKNNKPFTSVDELLDIQNIPKATFDIIKKHLTVQ